jgi:hypothetical protein
MIINKFHKHATYIFVRIITVIFILFCSFIFSWVFIGITKIDFSIFNFIFIAFIIAFLFLFFPYLTNRASTSLYKKISSQDNLNLLPNEKILSKSTFSMITGIMPLGYSAFPRNIIVTNFRISLGFLNTIPFLYKGKMEEKMGFMNLWNPNIKKIPEIKNEVYGIKSNSGLMNFLGSNTKIKDISYGTNSRGDFIIIHPEKYLVYLKFNHPDAKLIYNSFKA